MVPGVASPASLRSFDTQALHILSNTSSLQAVHHEKLDMVQAVFYEAGSLTCGASTLQADRPCVLLAKNISTGQPEIIRVDPTTKKPF